MFQWPFLFLTTFLPFYSVTSLIQWIVVFYVLKFWFFNEPFYFSGHLCFNEPMFSGNQCFYNNRCYCLLYSVLLSFLMGLSPMTFSSTYLVNYLLQCNCLSYTSIISYCILLAQCHHYYHMLTSSNTSFPSRILR